MKFFIFVFLIGIGANSNAELRDTLGLRENGFHYVVVKNSYVVPAHTKRIILEFGRSVEKRKYYSGDLCEILIHSGDKGLSAEDKPVEYERKIPANTKLEIMGSIGYTENQWVSDWLNDDLFHQYLTIAVSHSIVKGIRCVRRNAKAPYLTNLDGAMSALAGEKMFLIP